MANPQGAILASSDRGGIRIQYSKNPYGKKRDFDGNTVETGGQGALQGAAYGAGAAGGGGKPASRACCMLVFVSCLGWRRR